MGIYASRNYWKKTLKEKKRPVDPTPLKKFKKCFLLKKKLNCLFFFSFFRPNIPAICHQKNYSRLINKQRIKNRI